MRGSVHNRSPDPFFWEHRLDAGRFKSFPASAVRSDFNYSHWRWGELSSLIINLMSIIQLVLVYLALNV